MLFYTVLYSSILYSSLKDQASDSSPYALGRTSLESEVVTSRCDSGRKDQERSSQYSYWDLKPDPPTYTYFEQSLRIRGRSGVPNPVCLATLNPTQLGTARLGHLQHTFCFCVLFPLQSSPMSVSQRPAALICSSATSRYSVVACSKNSDEHTTGHF